MPRRSPAIPNRIWEEHKDRIVARYMSPKGTLSDTIHHMRECYGFSATQNQYVTKLKAWGIRKNATSDIWAFVDKRQRQRKLEHGKKTAFSIHGRTLTENEVNKEIARNVPTREQFTGTEDMPTPNGVLAYTPPSGLIPSPGLAIEIESLPYNQYPKWIYLMITSTTHPPLVASKTSLITLGSLGEPEDLSPIPDGSLASRITSRPLASTAMIQSILNANSETWRKHQTPHHLPPSYTLTATMTRICRNHPNLSIIIDVMTELFHLSTNNLGPEKTQRATRWLIKELDLITALNLCRLNEPWMEIFRRGMIREAILIDNIPLVRGLISMTGDYDENIHCEFLSLAVYARNTRLVELFCMQRAPRILSYLPGSWIHSLLPVVVTDTLWDARGILILKTILSCGADAHTFIRNEEPGFSLIHAASSGNLEAVQLLLNAGGQVNTYIPGEYGSALQAATAKGHLDIINILIQAGADVNVPDGVEYWNTSGDQDIFYHENSRLTPVQIAAQCNNSHIVETLVDKGASINACPFSPWESFYKKMIQSPYPYYSGHPYWHLTAIQYAAKNQNTDLIRFFLSKGINPDSRSRPDFGDTPLQIAARLGDIRIVRLLLEAGADVNAAPSRINGLTAIQAAAAHGSEELVATFLQLNAWLNAPAGEIGGLTALQAAAHHGHLSLLVFLCRMGGDINAAPALIAGRTVVQAAANYGDYNLLRNVIHLGGRINSPPTRCRGKSAICAAIKHEDVSILKLLIDNGAEINGPVIRRGCAPLSYALDRDWLEGVELLLSQGANIHATINMEDSWVTAILYELEEQCHWKIVERLIAAHGEFNTECCGDILASAVKYEAHIIRRGDDNQFQRFSLVRLLRDRLANISDHFITCQWRKAWDTLNPGSVDIQWVEFLLNEGIDVDYREVEKGPTMLQKILEQEQDYIQDETILYLIDRGADINAEATYHFETPLQSAVRRERFDIVRILLERGADVNAPPMWNGGMTALQAAAIKGCVDVAIQFLERGASVAVPAAEKNGRTAIDGAAEWGRLEMLQLLLNAYDGPEEIEMVCEQAAHYAEEERHYEIARWLRNYTRS